MSVNIRIVVCCFFKCPPATGELKSTKWPNGYEWEPSASWQRSGWFVSWKSGLQHGVEQREIAHVGTYLHMLTLSKILLSPIWLANRARWEAVFPFMTEVSGEEGKTVGCLGNKKELHECGRFWREVNWQTLGWRFSVSSALKKSFWLSKRLCILLAYVLHVLL